MKPKWQRNALSFIYTQRREELRRAIARFPNSDRLAARVAEEEELTKKLEDLEAE
jgi:hypothetical protein